MRIVAEHLPDTNQILIRLLGAPDPSVPDPGSTVQPGTYLVDGTPQLPAVIPIEVLAMDVMAGEANVYLTGYAPLPQALTITLPDLTVRVLPIGQVLVPEDDLLTEQPVETLTPDAHPLLQPAEARTGPVEAVVVADIPKLWCEVNCGRASALHLGAGVTGTLQYSGGCLGRALSATQAQVDVNVAPWLSGAPTKLEGTHANGLASSTWLPASPVLGFFDPVPVGWQVQQPATNQSLRITAGDQPLPTLRFDLNLPTGLDATDQVTTLLISPPCGSTFQIMAQAGPGAWLQLTSADSMVSTPLVSLATPQVLRLDLGLHPGPVRIIWTQNYGDGTPKALWLAGPSASTYLTAHSWIPSGATSAADQISIPDLQWPSWAFTRGTVRVDSDVDDPTRPAGWSIVSQAGPTLLRVAAGILSSDFSTTTVLLANYLSADPGQAGNYRVAWNQGGFVVRSAITGQPVGGQPIPFAFNLPIPSLVKTSPLSVSIGSFSPTAGSSVLRYWSFSPT
jgi:hypothetical protein